MRNKIIIIVCLILFVFIAEGQSSITGPNCVISGMEYQYSISTGSSGSVQVCVSGGSLVGGNNNCISSNSVSTIRVIWNDVQNGTITVSGASSGSKSISITKELQPGSITDSTIYVIQEGAIPATIHCSQANGGGCSSLYSYQWQRSIDNVTWENINNATSQDLSFSASISQATFFRRKVTNSVSNSVGYSDVATVFVIVQNQIAKCDRDFQLIRNSVKYQYCRFFINTRETKINTGI